jgi:hypothetical protein
MFSQSRDVTPRIHLMRPRREQGSSGPLTEEEIDALANEMYQALMRDVPDDGEDSQ